MPTPLSNGHEQFAIEMFCQWSSVSTISRTTHWRRYDKERLSIHCRKVSGKTKHFARYVPSVWLERHSFLMSYWLSMSVLTIPTLVIFYYNITYSVFESVFFYKSSCALGFFFCEVTAPMSNVKSCLVNNLPFKERVFFTSDLLFYAMSALLKAEKSSQAQARWLNKRENKTY